MVPVLVDVSYVQILANSASSILSMGGQKSKSTLFKAPENHTIPGSMC